MQVGFQALICPARECTCETAWETGPFAAASASRTGSGRFAEAASAAEVAAPAVALMLSCNGCLC